MLNARQLETLLKEACSEDNEYVDIRNLCERLRINISTKGEHLETTQMARFYTEDNEDKYQRRFITLSPSLSECEQNTVIAILIAKFCLVPDAIHERGHEVNVFDFKSLRTIRFSRLMYLATRIALPEEIIEKIDDITLSNKNLKATEMFTSDFVSCAVKGHTIQFLLDNRIH